MPKIHGRSVLETATKAANRFSHPAHIAKVLSDNPELTDPLDAAMRQICKSMDQPLRPVPSEEVVEMIPLGPQTIRKYIGDGRFPRPTKIGAKSVWPFVQIVALQTALGLIANDAMEAA